MSTHLSCQYFHSISRQSKEGSQEEYTYYAQGADIAFASTECASRCKRPLEKLELGRAELVYVPYKDFETRGNGVFEKLTGSDT